MEIENKETEFEFGSITEPTSPKSPADHLFSNGRLLPHLFPVQNTNTLTCCTSRASTISTKDSLNSSRSSSIISRTSSCGSSARTSISTCKSSEISNDGYDRRGVFRKHLKTKTKTKTVLVQKYGGSSHRWQLIAPTPVMKHGSKRKKNEIVVREATKKTKGGECFCWRILKWFVWVCRKCHSLEPPVREDELHHSLEFT